MVEDADVCRDSAGRACLRDPGELTHHDTGRLVVVALVPPRPALDPPAVFPLIVEQRAAPAAHVVLEPYLGILLHIHLDCRRRPLVPWQKRFF